jgi:SAM-dependent methyltransferase
MNSRTRLSVVATTTMRMELRNCPICNARASTADLIGPLADHQMQEGREFNLTCCACGDLIYLSPAPDESDIRAMYVDIPQFDNDEYRGDLVRAAADEFYYGRFRALLAKMNHPEDRALRVLEVGAGLSWMCQAAKKLNPRNVTVAQDISSEAAAECTWVDRYYVASDVMACREIEDQAPYDVISLTHVIEHLVDPVGALKRLRELMAPEGLFFITAPSRPPGWRRGDGVASWQNWSYNHVPAHVQYFSRQSMERAAREAGLELVFWTMAEEGQAFEAWLSRSTPAVSMVSPAVRERISFYRDAFSNAVPFPHIVIDNFFEPDKAEKLLEDFPPFDPANATNEFGEVGRKAVVTDIAKISPFYHEAYEYISSKGFLDLISQVTGIPDLVYDEQMFGAGTHENLEGQELDPHVDFNYIESTKLHRRLNLLLYLNTEWEQEWGGCLELHSNPRRPWENRIDVIRPVFNRCVVFETSERSWHGFERIRLPEGKKHLSRKLLSIYLYTRERPAEETVAPHGTFYVQRPLPACFAPGHSLTEDDVLEARKLIQGRDEWIEYYQRKEIRDSARIQQLTHFPGTQGVDTQAHLSGNARQEGRVCGMWKDGWIGSPFEITVTLLEPIDTIVLRLKSHPASEGEQELCVSVDGAPASRHWVKPGEAAIRIRIEKNAGDTIKLRITSYDTYCAARAEKGGDIREVVTVLEEILFLRESAPPPVPVAGCGHQEGPALVFWADGWIGRPFEAGIRLEEPIGSIFIEGYLPGEPPPEMEVTVRVNGVAVLRQKPVKGPFRLEVPAGVDAEKLLKVGITSNVSFADGNGVDSRDRVFVLREIRPRKETLSAMGTEFLRVPLIGAGRQEGSPVGFWPDGWIGNPFEVGVRLEEPVGSMVIEGYLPEEPPQEMELTLRVNGVAVLRQKAAKGPFTMEAPADVPAEELLKVRITSNVSFHERNGHERNGDTRERAIVLREIRLCKEGIDPHRGNSHDNGWPGRLRKLVPTRS